MNKLGFLLVVLAEFYSGPSRLEIPEIAAGGYLPVSVLTGEPDLDIECTAGRKTYITSAELYDPVGEAKQPQNLFSIIKKLLEILH